MLQTGLRASFHTLGCKLNFAETSTLARDLYAAGFVRTNFGQASDVAVINTCSVTQEADKETRGLVRQALRANPDCFIVVTGCFAQLRPSEVAAMEGVDLVLGAKEKPYLRRFLSDLRKRGDAEVHACEIGEADQYHSAYSMGDRTRAFLKVQDGCDYVCTYCTIPMARGVSRSAPLDQVVNQARELAAKGVLEVVLTGVNVGDYGKGEHGNKRHDHTFLELVQALDQVEGLDRLRISSIEPNLLRDEIIDFTAQSARWVPHFHIPLQSGNNEVLGWMKRRYRRELYAERVAHIIERMPDAAIGVDVIVGFPGETEAHFLDTYQFLEGLPIAYLHVFTYSERPGTEAIVREGVVEKAERKARNHRLRLLSAIKQRAFYEAHLGSVRRVVWEHSERDGRMLGYTDNYIRVEAEFDAALAGTRAWVRLTELTPRETVATEPAADPAQSAAI
ncbi:MAG: tRNA (N(6)-L-threonylcarbamoyladenosine(37)-C(2))-methylthiotransferase MtaB [Schleiferiaceae bacterium]